MASLNGNESGLTIISFYPRERRPRILRDISATQASSVPIDEEPSVTNAHNDIGPKSPLDLSLLQRATKKVPPKQRARELESTRMMTTGVVIDPPARACARATQRILFVLYDPQSSVDVPSGCSQTRIFFFFEEKKRKPCNQPVRCCVVCAGLPVTSFRVQDETLEFETNGLIGWRLALGTSS